MGKQTPAWIIGLVIIGVVEVILANMFFGPACSAPGIAQFVVLILIPGVYLPLMFLTLRSSGNGGPSQG
jgi:hypothetical protein